MKKVLLWSVLILSIIVLVGCSGEKVSTEQSGNQEISYEDGTYRGGFSDRGRIQVNIQFVLKDNKVEEVEFRHLEHDEVDYLDEENGETVALREQYEELINYLVGKDIRESLSELYEPENIVKGEADATSGATIRSSKVISAIRDGLNRGVYSY